MKHNNLSKIILTSVLCCIIGFSTTYACFDTYLFLNTRGMTLPKGEMSIDINGEYANDNGKLARDNEQFVFNYGVSEKLSLQVNLVSEKNQLNALKFDVYEAKAVYGLIKNRNAYSLDVILQHHIEGDGSNPGIEISTPNMWFFNNTVAIVHPVLRVEQNAYSQIRGHGGWFYNGIPKMIIGLGGEFESSQTEYSSRDRLVNSEFANSIFVGRMVSSGIYLQAEAIKGWATTDDYAFAATMRWVIKRPIPIE